MMIVGIIVGVLLLIAVAAYIFIQLYPPYGGTVDRTRKLADSDHYADGKFINLIPTESRDRSFRSTVTLFLDRLKKDPKRKPQSDLPVHKVSAEAFENKTGSSVTWLGHSAVLLKLEEATLLLDPMFGKYSSAIQGIGHKRYSPVPLIIEELPKIDAVLISHDHCDHLDYTSIRKLKDRVETFYVPLGVGTRLIRFGVEKEQIREFDWWEDTDLKGLKLVCTPARHFSGRDPLNRDKDSTLWCSWVITSQSTRVYFSGDSGYGPHFKKIGETYGPFDVTLMDCGQYDRRWADIHLFPEQAVEAHLDVRGKLLLPVHWAVFVLAFHGWAEPAERISLEAKRKGVQITTPLIGETVVLGQAHAPAEKWWRLVK
ncbi:MBL fold metallo-hydrolase [Paenibacillus caui]|uniref:MBL fold metallo-hydrolase n=1 Tax=Paenibacillus caui TaxID=2873927 RepID=UPI001F43B606|nr:MBL fold metallo-hydrolase [Paenibacillus caui]